MLINFKVRGIKELNDFLKGLPRGASKIALKAFTEYIIGNESHGLKHSDPYKYVSGKQAGYTWSKKQIRFFFATGIWESVNGQVKLNRYKRTGESMKMFQYVMLDDYKYKITNPTAGAYYVRDDKGQAGMAAKSNWRKVSAVIQANFANGIRSANAAINKWLGGKKI